MAGLRPGGQVVTQPNETMEMHAVGLATKQHLFILP